MIPFNRPPFVGPEKDYINQAIDNHKICGDGEFSKKCHNWLEDRTGVSKALLVTSGSTALDMAAILSGVGPGDEVILPSYTFVSTANAFVLRGASLVFVDIRPDTQNLDETLIEDAITDRTKVIAPVHYAGVGCEMDAIMDIAARHGLIIIEDAAQGVISTYKGRALGSIGDYGCYSFHETKNYSMGEGGALMIRDEEGKSNPEKIQVISPYRGEFYGTDSLNTLMQRTFNPKWSKKQLDGIGYFDKVIQYRNRPQSDPAYAYQDTSRKNIKSEIFNGEIGLTMIHGLDSYATKGQQPKYK